MKKIFFASLSLMIATTMHAQQKEGKITYERTMQIQMRINDNDQVSQMLPKTRTDKFEMYFGNNKSLFKHVDEEQQNDDFGGGGMQIKMVAPGMDDIIFCNDKSGRVEQRELFGKKFLVTDSIRKLAWKMGNETKTIAGYTCRKAVGQRYGKRMSMNINNGVMERKELNDTSNIVAWFTMDIPVSAGPEVPGQLPGLILALDINDGRMTYVATSISQKVDLSAIKEPVKGKKVSPEEFTAERNKMMDEMQKNNMGGNGRQVIRIQN